MVDVKSRSIGLPHLRFFIRKENNLRIIINIKDNADIVIFYFNMEPMSLVKVVSGSQGRVVSIKLDIVS